MLFFPPVWNCVLHVRFHQCWHYWALICVDESPVLDQENHSQAIVLLTTGGRRLPLHCLQISWQEPVCFFFLFCFFVWSEASLSRLIDSFVQRIFLAHAHPLLWLPVSHRKECFAGSRHKSSALRSVTSLPHWNTNAMIARIHSGEYSKQKGKKTNNKNSKLHQKRKNKIKCNETPHLCV